MTRVSITDTFLLTRMQEVEIDANSDLVQLLKKGGVRVTKKSLKERYGVDKKAIIRQTLKHPEALVAYKKAKEREPHLPLTHEAIAQLENQPGPDWEKLLNDVLKCEPGNKDADRYEKAVEALLTAVFYPVLTNPIAQHEIHDGRKRIDITYTNMALAGFFQWASTHYPAPLIFVECKNYGREVENPELDQLAGRFSPSRGQVGRLVCRKFNDKDLFLQRCKDTALDHRGFIIPIDDEDLRHLVETRKIDPYFDQWKLLRERFLSLIN
jgi:hypothetical protein